LGFVEDIEDSEFLTSEHFPNKVGGKPVCIFAVGNALCPDLPQAWLDLGHLPSEDQLVCVRCKKQMCFLMQVQRVPN
jgi:hypothetical protein